MSSWKHLESQLIFGAGLLVLLFGTGNYWSATWLSKWALLLSLSSVVISFWVAKKTSWFHLPLLIYASTSLLLLAVWPVTPYQELFDQVTTLAIQKNALYGFTIFMIGSVAFASVTKKGAFGVVSLMASIWMLGTLGTLALPMSGNHSPPNNGLWFGNPSMGASLLACLLPFAWSFGNAHLFKKKSHLLFFVLTSLALTLTAIYRTKSSIPWGVLCSVIIATTVARGFLESRSWKWLLRNGIATLAIFFLLGSRLLGHEFLDPNGRTEIWRMAWNFFWEHAHPAFGFGYSTSQVMLPIEQVMTGHFHGDYFLWLHSDWLQLAIEGGYIGMACVFLSLGRLLTASFRRPALFASLVGFVALGLFNYPLRMPIHCMCLVLVAGTIEAFAIRSVRKTVPRPVVAAGKIHLKPASMSVHS